MKLILREYLASLREREELDAILPDLLSELGFTVYSRPQVGTTQHGVDIAAVGPAGADGRRKLYLLSVKKGDLNRTEWNGNAAQALRPSLDDIIDSYIPTRIPPEYRELEIVICLCFGGAIREEIRTAVTGYMAAKTTDRISFEEWNGDRIAGMLLDGVLREDLLPKPFRSNFQKAVALLDEPTVSYQYFAALIGALRVAGLKRKKEARVRAARQIYLCVWVMFVWGRDVENLEAPYQASELALLHVWDLMKPLLGRRTAEAKAMTQVLMQLRTVHLAIANEYIETRIAPHVKARDALGSAVATRSPVDVNLALFDLLGRLAMAGLWVQMAVIEREAKGIPTGAGEVGRYFDLGLAMIRNNPALLLPVTDEQATSLALFLLLWAASSRPAEGVAGWLVEMTERYEYAVLSQSRYPTSKTEYRDLIVHPRNRSKAYFEDATAGSTLIPTLVAWMTAMGAPQGAATFGPLKAGALAHCEMQLWTVDETSEAHLYINDANHGRAISGLPVDDGAKLLRALSAAAGRHTDFQLLSAIQYGWLPLVLMACRHWRLPLPPELYISNMAIPGASPDPVEAHRSS